MQIYQVPGPIVYKYTLNNHHMLCLDLYLIFIGISYIYIDITIIHKYFILYNNLVNFHTTYGSMQLTF